MVAAVGVRAGRTVTGPLTELQHALGRLTAGQHTARVALCPAAPAEVQAVAAGVNALAEEGGRLRGLEQDRHRMHSLAGSIGRAVREDLDARTVVEHAAAALGRALHADRVCLRLVRQDGQLPTVQQWTAPDVAPSPTDPLADHAAEQVGELHEHGRALLACDSDLVPGGDGKGEAVEQLALGRQLLADAGARCLVAVPVAAGDAVFGLLTVAQTTPRTWTTPETDLIGSVAADLARGLRHAQLHARQRDLVAQLQQLDQARTEFVSTASHELRTPLTSVAGYLEKLREGELGALTTDQDHALDVIDRNTTRLRALVEDLLTLSSVTAGAGAPHRMLDVAKLLHAATETVGPAAASAGVHLSVHPGPPGLTVHGDPGQLDRVLLNLVSNAIKVSRTGDQVRVSACPTPAVTADGAGRVTLTVTDTGIGIPTADQKHLFSRFHRASNATTRGIAGTGLGLTIVRSIVEQHGGSLRLTSVEGAGTTVEVVLPAHPTVPHTPADTSSRLTSPA